MLWPLSLSDVPGPRLSHSSQEVFTAERGRCLLPLLEGQMPTRPAYGWEPLNSVSSIVSVICTGVGGHLAQAS